MKTYEKITDDVKKEIITQYSSGKEVKEVAKITNLSIAIIYKRFREWGIKLRPKTYPNRAKRKKKGDIYIIKKDDKPSQKLLAQRAVNNVINHQFVRRVSAGDSPEDQRLISAMLQMVIRG
jgi:transposase